MPNTSDGTEQNPMLKLSDLKSDSNARVELNSYFVYDLPP